MSTTPVSDDVTRSEARLASQLREAAETLLSRTTLLLSEGGKVMDRMAAQMVDVLAPAPGDSITEEGAESTFVLLERMSRVIKLNAEAVEKIIKVERQVRGDPTDSIAVTGHATPETSNELAAAMRLELAALDRHRIRTLSDGSDD
jgi:hypothetical protein